MYVLRPDDEIEVFVYRHPVFSRRTTIRPDGLLSLPLLGEIKTAGKAPRELNEQLPELFGQRLVNPEVTVIVENALKPMVFVRGEVGAPRTITLRQSKTVAQAFAQSGTVIKAGSLSSVAIIRVNEKGFLEAHTVNAEGYSQPEIYMALNRMILMPNDLVLVSESYRGQLPRAVQDFNTLYLSYFQIRLLGAAIR